jgi:AcrR family transcriptional regulator
MARRLTPRGEERRRQLMDFATVRFAERGYHTTSVAEIVQGLGVGKGVFYWYFESKDALLLAILQEAQRDLRRAQQEAIEGEPDPVHRIELGIRASMRWYAEHRAVNQVSAFARTEERFAAVLRKGTEVAVQDTARHLRDAVDRGAVRDGDVELQANAILGVTRHLARRFLHDAGRPLDDVADEAVAFCMGGLGVNVPATPAVVAGP